MAANVAIKTAREKRKEVTMTKKSEQYEQRIIQIDSRIAELQKQKRLLETKRKEALDHEFMLELQHCSLGREEVLNLIRQHMEGGAEE